MRKLPSCPFRHAGAHSYFRKDGKFRRFKKKMGRFGRRRRTFHINFLIRNPRPEWNPPFFKQDLLKWRKRDGTLAAGTGRACFEKCPSSEDNASFARAFTHLRRRTRRPTYPYSSWRRPRLVYRSAPRAAHRAISREILPPLPIDVRFLNAGFICLISHPSYCGLFSSQVRQIFWIYRNYPQSVSSLPFATALSSRVRCHIWEFVFPVAPT